MVVMCALHLAIFLEICGAVAFLHSLLMSAIVCPSYVSVLATSGLHAWTCSCESVRVRAQDSDKHLGHIKECIM